MTHIISICMYAPLPLAAALARADGRVVRDGVPAKTPPYGGVYGGYMGGIYGGYILTCSMHT